MREVNPLITHDRLTKTDEGKIIIQGVEKCNKTRGETLDLTSLGFCCNIHDKCS